MCARGAIQDVQLRATSRTTLFTKRLPCYLFVFLFQLQQPYSQPSNFLITNPFTSKSTPNRQAEPGGGCASLHTPPPPDRGQQKQRNCMCKKVDLGTRIAEFVYRAETPQLGCQSYQELRNANLAKHTYPESGEVAAKPRTGFPGAGAGRPARPNALGPPAAVPLPLPPQPLSLKGVENASTRKCPSGLPTAPIKTQRHSPGKRAREGHYLPVA